VKPRRVKKLDAKAPFAQNAARIIRVRLSELRSFVPAALERENADQQHDMRIAAKRLRYVLESTEMCFGKPAQTARRRAKDLQDILGDLHDCDVMLPRVEAHLDELREQDAEAVWRRAGAAPDLEPELAARAPNRTSFRGLDVLAVYLRARRRLLFDRFTDFWAEQERAGTWDDLDRAAAAILRDAKERRRAARRAQRAERELVEAERERQAAAERARTAAAQLERAERTVRGLPRGTLRPGGLQG
jgi:hypothetical protein